MDLGAASAGTRQSKSLGCWERRCLLWNKWRRDSEVRNSSCWLSSRDVLGSRVHDFCYLVYSFMHSSLICKDNCKSCIRGWFFSVDGCVYWRIISRSVVSVSHSAQSQLFSFDICCLHSVIIPRTLSWSHEPWMSCDQWASGRRVWVNSDWWKMLFGFRLM